MPVVDPSTLDFSHLTVGTNGSPTRAAVHVHNPDTRAVLHVGLQTSARYCDLFPTEFALAPGETQTVSAILRPERAGPTALTPGDVRLWGQYIALHPEDAAALPPDMDLTLPIVLPGATCPHCGADLPDGASECRHCGERIRPCPICGTPNTWLARVCRVGATHVLRPGPDWTHMPGGSPAHFLPGPAPAGTHLSRLWSSPNFPRARDAWEWSAPLLAFGMTLASYTDTAASTARIGAWETSTGSPLWEFVLPGAQGLYPDRGAMALSADGTLYAATLTGQVAAIDVVRGTRRWTSEVAGAVYGGVTVGGDSLLVPTGNALCMINHETGAKRHLCPLGGRLDTAPAYDNETAFCTCDDGSLYAFSVGTGTFLWQAPCGGPFDAAPVVYNDLVLAATLHGSVLAFRAATGEAVWQVQVTDRAIAAAPAITPDGLLLVGDDGGTLHVLDAARGSVLRARSVTDTPIRVSPAAGGRTVFVGADDGNIYALDENWNTLRVYETVPGARIVGAGLALSGDLLAFACTNGALYVCRTTP